MTVGIDWNILHFLPERRSAGLIAIDGEREIFDGGAGSRGRLRERTGDAHQLGNQGLNRLRVNRVRAREEKGSCCDQAEGSAGGLLTRIALGRLPRLRPLFLCQHVKGVHK